MSRKKTPRERRTLPTLPSRTTKTTRKMRMRGVTRTMKLPNELLDHAAIATTNKVPSRKPPATRVRMH